MTTHLPPPNDLDSEYGGPVSSFQSYSAEGDNLAKQGDYRKAVEAYSKALELRHGDKNCLVDRSRCFLRLGDAQSALDDANSSLKEDPAFFKGVFQKAEALYAKGDFEMALVHYHRGKQFRPEIDEFRLGIQKAREAIDNSIGNPKDYKFATPKLLASPKDEHTPHKNKAENANVSFIVAAPIQSQNNLIKTQMFGKIDINCKQLLEELYEDKLYLDELANDKDFISSPNHEITSLVNDALVYLDTRTEFWRQQKPIYARRKDHARIRAKVNKANKAYKKKEIPQEPVLNNHQHLIQNGELKTIGAGFRSIYKAIERQDYEFALKTAENLLPRLGDIFSHGKRMQLMAECYSLLGTIHLEFGNMTQALSFHRKDYQTSQDEGLLEGKKRALANLGKTFVRWNKFKDAIIIFKERLNLVSNPNITDESGSKKNLVEANQNLIECAWLMHDLSRCNLELGNIDIGLEYAEKGVAYAEKAKEKRWSLNLRLLLAQIRELKSQFKEANISYNAALTHAKELDDSAAQGSILAAMADIGLRWSPSSDSRRNSGKRVSLTTLPVASSTNISKATQRKSTIKKNKSPELPSITKQEKRQSQPAF